jgi:hypothetical protein
MLPEEEAYKIQQLAILFPEVQEEIDTISQSLEGLATVAAVAPAPVVKDNIMNKLRALKVQEDQEKVEEHTLPGFNPLTIAATENPLNKVEDDEASDLKESPVVSMSPRSGNAKWLTAASVIGLVISLGTIIYLVSENKKTKNDLASLSQKVNTLNNQTVSQQQQILAFSQTMLMAESKEVKKIGLAPLPGKEEALANVLWNTKTHEVYVSDMSLPKAPSGKQYQLWAIVDGKPVNAGLISDAKYLAQKMKEFEKADAFAISIEQEGGSPEPTEVYMMGKTS